MANYYLFSFDLGSSFDVSKYTHFLPFDLYNESC